MSLPGDLSRFDQMLEREHPDAEIPNLDDHRERKAKAHRWTRWRDEIPKRFEGPNMGRALEVAGELARRADNDTGHCWAHLSNLASRVGRSPRTVQRAIADLKLNGLVTVKTNGRGRLDFWLRPLPDRVASETTPWRTRSDTVSHQKRHGVASETTPWRGRDDTVSPLTTPGTSPGTTPLETADPTTTCPPSPTDSPHPCMHAARGADGWMGETEHVGQSVVGSADVVVEGNVPSCSEQQQAQIRESLGMPPEDLGDAALGDGEQLTMLDQEAPR